MYGPSHIVFPSFMIIASFLSMMKMKGSCWKSKDPTRNKKRDIDDIEGQNTK